MVFVNLSLECLLLLVYHHTQFQYLTHSETPDEQQSSHVKLDEHNNLEFDTK